MIIITGLGRSGTSMMAEFLGLCGISNDLEHSNYYEKFRAGMEDRSAQVINASFMKHYHQERPLHHVDYHKDKIQAIKHNLIKDPEFVAIPSIIQHWWDARKDIQIIYMWRDYDAIQQSQLAVPTMKTPVYRCFPHMMRKVEKDFLWKVTELEIPHIMVNYDDIKIDGVVTFLRKHGYEIRKNYKAVWEQTWNPRR